jgi:hypothetical protein
MLKQCAPTSAFEEKEICRVHGNPDLRRKKKSLRMVPMIDFLSGFFLDSFSSRPMINIKFKI